MKLKLTYLGIVFSSNLYCQSSVCFKNIVFDSSYSVVGIQSLWGKPNKMLEGFSFIINKNEDLVKLKNEWIFENKTNSLFEDESFDLNITKNKIVVKRITINPILGTIKTDDGWYRFDTTILAKLHSTNALKWRIIKREFKDINNFEAFYDSALKVTPFLFLEKPDLRFEGTFTIVIEKSSTIRNPNDAIQLIKKEYLITELEKKCEITYELDKYNLTQPNQSKMRLNIASDKLFFEEVKKSNYEFGDWQPLKIYVSTFWRR